MSAYLINRINPQTGFPEETTFTGEPGNIPHGWALVRILEEEAGKYKPGGLYLVSGYVLNRITDLLNAIVSDPESLSNPDYSPIKEAESILSQWHEPSSYQMKP